VAGFSGSDVVLNMSTAGGTLVSTVTGSASTYNVAVSGMTTAGNVLATIPADAVMDLAHDENHASTSTDNSVLWQPDTTPPTVTVNQASSQADPTSTSPITFTATFSKPVTGLWRRVWI
jgi:hypothetical protein